MYVKVREFSDLSVSRVCMSKLVGVPFLVLHTDDILLIGNDTPAFQEVISWLGKCFSMKHLVEATYILGIRI